MVQGVGGDFTVVACAAAGRTRVSTEGMVTLKIASKVLQQAESRSEPAHDVLR